MKTLDKLEETLALKNGIITSKDAHSIKISNMGVSSLVRSAHLEKVGHGIYVHPDTFVDEMYITQLNKTKMIYSHETALFLHDLTDRDPLKYSVTVPTGYNSKTLLTQKFKVFSINEELHDLGKTKAKTMYGNTVSCYNIERTICDIIRSRKRVNQSLIPDALKRYVNRKDKNIVLLTEMAEKFRIAKTINLYLEVLM